MPTLRQLKALSLIAQTASFTQAAERLFITQSAVSALIRGLEVEVGHQLIIRGRALRLTSVGEHIERASQRAQYEIDRALQEVRGDHQWTEEVVRVAAGSLSAATLVPKALAQLARANRRVRVVVIDRPVAMVQDLLLSGEADVAIGVDPGTRAAPELNSELLLRDALSVVSSRKSELAREAGTSGAALTWKALERAELILIGPVGGQWNSLLRKKASHFAPMKIAYEVQLFSTGMELVRQGLGVAVLPRFATLGLDRKMYAVHDLRPARADWTTYWVTRKNADVVSPGFTALHQAFKDAAKALRTS